MRALRNGHTDALHRMYRNFFRDPCGAGLVGVPFGNRKAYFRRKMKDVHRRAYLGDALYRLDYWNSRTGGGFDLHDLAAPNIGNPYGILLNDTLIRFSAEYHHDCAHEILKLNSTRRVVAEIGGGYGALAYYLLRDGGKLTYMDFDVPESIALASYYLLKAFPSRNFTLYGEREFTEEAIAASDALLLPSFAMQKIPSGIVNVTLASHVLSDLSRDARAAYTDFVSRSTQDHFVYFGSEAGVASLFRLLQTSCGCAHPQLRASDWNRHKVPDFREVQVTYRFPGK
ncbi:MAG TPA: putative sugar O-methyltransferase [Candidatus Sulfotelmatobacter sp.]|nr:putative sugar O-methyltransferase [Candidatus Sulfotelmatobacter sp.]